MLGQIVALANQKGGVGKTTTAVNIAHGLAARGHQTLLLDLDPQGNSTSSLGLDKLKLPTTTYDLLLDSTSTEDAVLHEVRPRLDLIGSNAALAGVEVELVSLTRRERRLEAALSPLRERYEVIIIDCPPSLGLLTVNALTTAQEIIIPIQCEYLALEGLMQLINTMDLVKRRLNPALDVLGVVMTMYDARTRLSAQVAENVRRYFPSRMFETIVPRSVRLAEAPSHGLTVFEHAPQSSGAEAYRLLTAEVAKRLGLPEPLLSEPAGAEFAAQISTGSGESLATS